MLKSSTMFLANTELLNIEIDLDSLFLKLVDSSTKVVYKCKCKDLVDAKKKAKDQLRKMGVNFDNEIRRKK